MLVHTVSAGETWFDISERYDLSIDYIKRLNTITYDDLVTGQEIIIAYPQTEYYAIQGDTVEGIARMFGTTTLALLRNNPYLARGLNVGDRVVVEFVGEKQGSILLNGYCYTFIDPMLFVTVLPYLSFVTIFTYGFTPQGTLVEPEPSDEFFVRTALAYGTAPLMHLSTLTENGNFSNELAGILLNDRSIWPVFIENIINNVETKGYRGVDIDFEYLPSENSGDYADFVGELGNALRSRGFWLITALAPKTYAEQPGLLYEGHDYTRLGENSDLVLLMTYEWGYAYSAPMAVAPIKSVERVVVYGVSEISSDKILMGLPFYGYDWKLPYIKGETVGQSLSIERALYLARRYDGVITFDDESASPYMRYFANDNEHIVWFESPNSIILKAGIINTYKLAGGGIWNIDRPFYQGYMTLNLMYDIVKII